MTLDFLLEHKLVPAGTRLAEMKDLNLIPVSDVMSGKREYESGSVVVMDGATWVAVGKLKQGDVPYFSGVDDESMEFGLCHRKRYHDKKVVYGKDGLPRVKPTGTTALSEAPKKDDKNTIMKEDKDMSSQQEMDLRKALEDAEKDANYSTEFTPAPEGDMGDGKKKKKDVEKPLTDAQILSKAIKDANNDKYPNRDRLVNFMRQHAKHLGFVTANDDQLVISVKKERLLIGGEPQVKSDALSQQKASECRQQGKTYPISICQTIDTLNPKQNAPGKILGGVVSMPRGGMVPWSAFSFDDGTGQVNFDAGDTTAVSFMFPIDFYYPVLHMYLGDLIAEDARTYGDQASRLRVMNRVSHVKPKEGSTPGTGSEKKVRPQLRVETKRSLVMPNAYIPISVFKTMSYANIRKQEDVDAANNSLLGDYVRGVNAFNPVTEGNAEGVYSEKYNKQLSAEMKAEIHVELRDGNPVIVSPWFTTSGNQRPLNVPSYYNKDVNVVDLEIPIKEAVAKKQGPGARWVTRKVNALAKELSSEDAAISSLVNPKFEAFRSIAGDAVSKEKLQTLRRGSAGGKKDKDMMDFEAMSIMYMGGATQGATLAAADPSTLNTALQDMFSTIGMDS